MQKTDLDLPPAYRTRANFWKAKFFEMREEVVKANKGIRRLRRKLACQPAVETDADSCADKDDCKWIETTCHACAYFKSRTAQADSADTEKESNDIDRYRGVTLNI